jgi:hypothetical protein
VKGFIVDPSIAEDGGPVAMEPKVHFSPLSRRDYGAAAM